MIILIGLPKCGTLSFTTLFKKLGYNSYHWKKNKKYIGMLIYKNKINNKPLLNDFLDTDVITQMDVCINEKNAYWPQIIDYKRLYEENPNALFILNKRNPEDLLSSFKNWEKLDKRLYEYNPDIIIDKTDKGFINFVNKFYYDVENYFLSNSNSKFVSYHIVNDNIKKLEKYIDLKGIKKLPHKHRSKK